MKRISVITALSAAVLAGCGGGSTSVDGGQQRAASPTEVLGGWEPRDSAQAAYEFYATPNTAPFSAIKTGRILKNGETQGLFVWEAAADGTVRIAQADPACPKRPIDQCPVVARVIVTPGADTTEGTTWKFAFDDNADGSTDRQVSTVYTRTQLKLSTIPTGEFLMNRTDFFDSPFLAYYAGNSVALRLTSFGTPVVVTAPVANDSQTKVEFSAGEKKSVQRSATFTMTSGERRELPVKMWFEKVTMAAGAARGFIVEYEIHRKILFPNDVSASSVQVGEYEKPELRTLSVGRIEKFVHGPTIRAGDKFNTFMAVDFDPSVVASAAGNDLVFSSATEGTISYTDPYLGKYSERRKFSWKQEEDGKVVMTFLNGMSISLRFVKAINGGYQVVYTMPDLNTGTRYVLHDLVVDGPSIVGESELPGHYTFVSTDGVTINHITLHKDKRVSGAVGGYWFQDANGDVVSFECTDLAGRDLTRYEDCYASFANLPGMSFSHVRRLRFMHKEGDTYQVKYNANVYGQRFGIFDRDYMTFAHTYRFKRIGNE